MSDTPERIPEAELTESVDTSAETSAEEAPVSGARKWLGWIFDYVEILVFSVCVVLLIFTFCFRICRVNGRSMKNTLEHGQMLVTTSLVKPEAGDIVVFHMTGDTYNEPLVKRIIATEGQTVQINYRLQTVSVDGILLDEPYMATLDWNDRDIGFMWAVGEHHMSDSIFEATVPEGCLFVMGDNRNNSADSRSAAIAFVDERRVLGKVICRLSPYTVFD